MKKTWYLSFGFFSISLTWAIYNAFVPFFLEKFIASTFIIGFIMTIDNYLALFIQPWIGRKSDRTSTRFGRRMPYLLIGMPLAALCTAFIPFHISLWTLLLFTVTMNLAMSLFRSPTVALMPDITPDRERSRANGIINFMGGVGAIIAFAIGSKLYDLHESFPFMLAAVLMIVSMVILYVKIKEKRDTLYDVPAEQPEISFRAELDKSTVFLLLAIFFWFVSYQGVEAMFTLYGKNHLGLAESEASFSLVFYSLALVVFAIPSGFLGAKFGKKRMIMIGIAGLAATFVAMIWVDSLWTLRILLLAGGTFWACININSYPYVVGMGEDRKIGTRTGLYYLVSSVAAIASPPLLGLLIDGFGYGVMFYFAALSMVIAFVMISQVRRDSPERVT